MTAPRLQAVARSAVGAGVGFLLLAGLAGVSRLPYETGDGGRALLRLSWRARGERIERCRPATPAELANVPAHMRREVICESARIAPYRLEVVVDGAVLADGIVAGSNGRGDRPIYVLRDFELAPGRHRLEVRFTRVAAADTAGVPAGTGAAASGSPADARRAAIPPRLALDTTMAVPAGTVVLVAYDSEARRLEVMDGSARKR